MMRLASRCLGVAAALAALSVPAPTQAQARPQAEDGLGLQALERASARYAGATSLCADFQQHLSVPLLGDEREGRGRLCQERPNRFAMRFDEPAGDAVVMDGTWVWVYYPSMDEGQVLRFPMAQAPGGFDFHREFLERPAEKYRIAVEGSEALDGHPTLKVRLTPRAPTSYQSALVWIDTDDALLRQVRVEEENGSVRTVTLTNIRMDVPAPDGWFRFTPPAGAQVIGR